MYSLHKWWRILECNELIIRNKDIEENPVYENIFKGNVNKQIIIAKIFLKKIEIKEKLNKNWRNWKIINEWEVYPD